MSQRPLAGNPWAILWILIGAMAMGSSCRNFGPQAGESPRKPTPLEPTPRARFSNSRLVQVHGHRGCRGLRPENTMAAFRHAVALGVDVLELDLGLTEDGVLVVIHDPVIDPKRCEGAETLPTRRIARLSWRQLSRLDCGNQKHPDFPQQQQVPQARIPRLEQVLQLLLEHPDLKANVEIKTDPHNRQLTRPPLAFAQALVPLLQPSALSGRVIVQSFDPEALIAVRKLAAAVPLAALADRRVDLQPLLQATQARIASPRYTEITAADVARLHGQGVQVIPWTINQPRAMEQALSWGVDGIITDRPDLLLQLLDR